MPDQDEENNKIKLAVIARDVTYIKERVDSIERSVAAEFVTKAEFDPIKRLVYGTVSIILVSFVGAIVALIIKK